MIIWILTSCALATTFRLYWPPLKAITPNWSSWSTDRHYPSAAWATTSDTWKNKNMVIYQLIIPKKNAKCQSKLTVKIREGMGVCCLTWNSWKNLGRCPSWAPVANRRADVKRTPFTPPKVLNATKMGTIKARGPKTRLPKVTATANELSISGLLTTAK